MWLVLVLVACSKSTAPTGGHALDDAELSPCMDQCLERTMAQAVAHESLVADCAQICDVDYVVRDGSDTVQLKGQRVLAIGIYEQTLHHGPWPEPFMGTAVVLTDGMPLWISSGEPPVGWEGLLGQEVEVVGTLAHGPDDDPDLWLKSPELPE